MSKKSVHVVSRFVAKPGKLAELKSRLQELVKLTNEEPGCVQYYLVHGVMTPDGVDKFSVLFMIEHFADQAAAEHHVAQPYLQKFIQDCPAMVAESEVIICE